MRLWLGVKSRTRLRITVICCTSTPTEHLSQRFLLEQGLPHNYNDSSATLAVEVIEAPAASEFTEEVREARWSCSRFEG